MASRRSTKARSVKKSVKKAVKQPVPVPKSVPKSSLPPGPALLVLMLVVGVALGFIVNRGIVNLRAATDHQELAELKERVNDIYANGTPVTRARFDAMDTRVQMIEDRVIHRPPLGLMAPSFRQELRDTTKP